MEVERHGAMSEVLIPYRLSIGVGAMSANSHERKEQGLFWMEAMSKFKAECQA